MSASGNSEVGAFLLLLLFVLCFVAFGAGVGAKAMNRAWKEEALAHGAVVYVLEGDEAVLKWKDEVKE